MLSLARSTQDIEDVLTAADCPAAGQGWGGGSVSFYIAKAHRRVSDKTMTSSQVFSVLMSSPCLHQRL